MSIDLAHGNLGTSLTTGQPVTTELRNRLPASAELTLLGLIVSIVIAVPLGILAATKPNSLIDHACRVVSTRRRVAAGVLHRAHPGLRVLLSARLGAGAARPARRVLYRTAACHRLLPDRQPDCRRSRNVHGEPQAAHPAGAYAGHFLAGADHPHDAGLDARRAVLRFRAHGAGERAVRLYGDRHLRVPQRHAAGHHHARHGVFVPPRRQRAGGESVRLARHRLLRGRGAARLRFRAGAGFRADHGGHVRHAQSR